MVAAESNCVVTCTLRERERERVGGVERKERGGMILDNVYDNGRLSIY